MEPGLASYGFSLIAGVLSTLSPCVLPILPVLLGSAAAAHPRAPLALAGGLGISYGVIGTLIAWVGASVGIDGSMARTTGAILLGLLGVVLMSASLQRRFSSATSAIGDAGNSLVSMLDLDGLRGQFLVGLALGVVWSPCVGPTLGAAIMLASTGTNVLHAGTVMAVFGLGAALPIACLAYVSRSAIAKSRARLLQTGKTGKMAMGTIMVLVAALILTGAEKPLEAWMVDISPAWLTSLTTRL